MGTRADFYVGRGADAEWLGSIPFDGHFDGMPAELRMATTEADYRQQVAAHLEAEGNGTTPDMGWPWPWNDSHTTDYAYAFDAGTVYGSCFGAAWASARVPEPEEWPDGTPTVFPNMSARKAVTFGPRSGLIVIGPEGIE